MVDALVLAMAGDGEAYLIADKAKRDLGYQPIVGIDEGPRRTAVWYRDNGHL